MLFLIVVFMAIHLYTDIYSFTLIISYNETLYNVNNDEKSSRIMLIMINIIVNISLVFDLIRVSLLTCSRLNIQ